MTADEKVTKFGKQVFRLKEIEAQVEVLEDTSNLIQWSAQMVMEVLERKRKKMYAPEPDAVNPEEIIARLHQISDEQVYLLERLERQTRSKI